MLPVVRGVTRRHRPVDLWTDEGGAPSPCVTDAAHPDTHLRLIIVRRPRSRAARLIGRPTRRSKTYDRFTVARPLFPYDRRRVGAEASGHGSNPLALKYEVRLLNRHQCEGNCTGGYIGCHARADGNTTERQPVTAPWLARGSARKMNGEFR